MDLIKSVRVGADIGGTFTDIVAARRRRRGADAQGPVDARRLRPRRSSTALRSCSSGAGVHAGAASPRSSTARPSRPTRSSSAGRADRAASPRAASATCSRSGRLRMPGSTTSTWDKPTPLVPRALAPRGRRAHRRRTARSSGRSTRRRVARPLERAAWPRASESIAVCLLHTYAQPGPRAAVGALLRGSRARPRRLALVRGPAGDRASTSAPARPSSTPTCGRSLRATSRRCARQPAASSASRAPLLVMQSNGGVMSGDGAATRPVTSSSPGRPPASIGARRARRDALGLAER